MHELGHSFCHKYAKNSNDFEAFDYHAKCTSRQVRSFLSKVRTFIRGKRKNHPRLPLFLIVIRFDLLAYVMHHQRRRS